MARVVPNVQGLATERPDRKFLRGHYILITYGICLLYVIILIIFYVYIYIYIYIYIYDIHVYNNVCIYLHPNEVLHVLKYYLLTY